MPILRRKEEQDPRVRDARLQMDLAVLRMAALLDQVELQAEQAKEELSERTSG